jgi:hypothetical protein
VSHVIFKIGPLQEPAGVSAYFVFPGRAKQQAFFAGDDDAAFSEILAAYSRSELAADSQLADVAQRHGIAVRELAVDEAKQLAMMTFELALPRVFNAVRQQDAIHQLAAATRFFSQASPWDGPFAMETIGLAVTGSITGRFFARILGSQTGNRGLVIFTREIAVDDMTAPDVDMLGITIEPEPAFAIPILSRIYGVPGVPFPLKKQSGQSVPVGELDLLLLSAAMRCVAVLEDSEEGSESEVGIEGMSVGAAAFVVER